MDYLTELILSDLSAMDSNEVTKTWRKQLYCSKGGEEQLVTNLWKRLGEKPSLYAVGKKAHIAQPMMQFFRYCGWYHPLPSFFWMRMKDFIGHSAVLMENQDLNALAGIAYRFLSGGQYDKESMARWAERFLGVRLGVKPAWDDAADKGWKQKKSEFISRSRGCGYGRYGGGCLDVPPDPNRCYHDWMRKRDNAAEETRIRWREMVEYMLRHIIQPGDYDIKRRNDFLELMGRELYKEVCGCCERHEVSYSKQQWDKYGKQAISRLIDEAATTQRGYCKFSEYDFDALLSLVGNERSALLQFLECRSYAKIESEKAFAKTELDKFSQAVEIASRASIGRHNQYEVEFRILKSKIKVVVDDAGIIQRISKWFKWL